MTDGARGRALHARGTSYSIIAATAIHIDASLMCTATLIRMDIACSLLCMMAISHMAPCVDPIGNKVWNPENANGRSDVRCVLALHGRVALSNPARCHFLLIHFVILILSCSSHSIRTATTGRTRGVPLGSCVVRQPATHRIECNRQTDDKHQRPG